MAMDQADGARDGARLSADHHRLTRWWRWGSTSTRSTEAELAKAEKLLIKVKPHLFAINSDYQPSMRSTDAWMTMCWTNDGAQLNRDMPEIAYMLGKDGGEIWTDYYAIPTSAPNKAAGYALLELPDGSRERGQGAHRQWGADHRQPRARAAARGRDLEQDRLSRRGIADPA